MELIERIFSIKSKTDFDKVALDVFHYQVEHCSVYREYVEKVNRNNPSTIEDIPFLPISFFKTHSIKSTDFEPQVVFKSSGTSGQRSTHQIKDSAVYERSFTSIYTNSIGIPSDQVILALLPNYQEQGESSLVYMVDHLIKQSADSLSGFVLDDLNLLIARYKSARKLGKQVVIFGVSYALLDLCELTPNLSDATIIETGGMKGRRKELTKKELHQQLRLELNCDKISSEYGMTELLSQSYSIENGLFELCPWMDVQLRDISDPFASVREGKTGGINVIDLANIHSCSFIATDDLGRFTDLKLELMGRFDHTDVRGCNQMVL